ncbi:MAG: DNA-binding response regulator [Campylobacterota bacterium]|nr:DNA-binding response regulator [Campylobacterota bacterium]MDQ1339741.1 DNA-binding response regulator [Campylobacterota bacterium]
MNHILIVEDDKLLAQTLEDILDVNGFSSKIANNYEEAIELDRSEKFDLYLLDINLPISSGIRLLKELRINNMHKPAIFLTSHKEKEVLNEAFSSGCDDFIKKPFDNDELIHRIEAVLKRTAAYNTEIKLTQDISYDIKDCVLSTPKGSTKLPQKLAKLLEIFIDNKNQIVSKEYIIKHVWGDDTFSSGSLRVYITKLKNLLGKDMIENIKGVGYKLKL